MESADLERSYSLEQQGLGPGHEAIASPVALVRSFTSKSRSSSRSRQSSRNRTRIESSRATRLRELEKDVQDCSEAEKNSADPIEKAVSRTPSTLTSHNGTNVPSEASSGQDEHVRGQRVIRW
ncbi:uncharacterized protein SETTUDRAFT_20865 [Exserohilum turcica Et28A]|uniref:Uncharacterized protein n=1 Tax=Exserohilum turcicum (strain 28A) TaxID=671987 RepID=R0IKF8_EXST2|nr:uncharacterized protein SETTUDRAFT_20865 [Exserohilum turcica Et28A]EOA85361.1 hypothetical protein SETTUDRAFT_20865 [Exserohilum turcica Et28A]